MNYDPIHDTYSQAPSSTADLSAAPRASSSASISNMNNPSLPTNISGQAPNPDNPVKTEPTETLAQPAHSSSQQSTIEEAVPAPIPPKSFNEPLASTQDQSLLHGIPRNDDKVAVKNEPDDKLSINNLLEECKRIIPQEPPSETTFHEDDEDDDGDDDDEDDEDDEDEEGDDDREASHITSSSKIPGQLPPYFRSVSKGFRHLKKADGEPFWRKDIQYDFLDELFKDDNQVFTNPFPFCQVPNAANGPKLTFAELYVRTLAESSKSSRVLRERLIKDKEMGISVSKVCLLVNAGRMNTTVNFVPDMRSALRTYHSIPSLEANRFGPSRPLQDTPRLKTILKAVCDGQGHLQTLLDLLRSPTPEKPNTNVIKLIFLMSTFFQNIPFHHDGSLGKDAISEQLRFVKATSGPQNKFMEFFLGDNIYPKNRARRFLWLLYTYLETSFSPEELEKNPFNPSVIPTVEHIRQEDMTLFDNDEDYEVEYATKMYHTRMMHLNEEINNTNPKRGNKSKVERQRIRKQLTSDHHYRPGGERKQEDLADDSSVGDDTIHPDESEVTFTEAADDSGRASYFQKFVSGSKRKKPTPSVGALVEFSRKDALVDMKWANPSFPVYNIDWIRQRYSPCTKSLRVPALTRDSETSVLRKKDTIRKTQHIVDLVSSRNSDYEQVRENVLGTLGQQFTRQCAKGNGLLAVEWDSIKSEIQNGIEAYLYQQFGKSMATHINDKDRAEEQLFFRNPDNIRKESFMSGTEKLLGDSSPIDIGMINNYGTDFTPIEEFNNAGERSSFEFELISKLLDEQEEKVEQEEPRQKRICFDLTAEKVLFN